jgi:hypothetical protein
MTQTPPPVDLSRLGSILNKSRQVMNVVESKSPKTQNREYSEDTSYQLQETEMYSENDEKEMAYEGYTPTEAIKSLDYSDEQVMASKLPDSIKKAMLENRIPKLTTPPSKFTAEDISRLTGAPIKTQQKKVLTETQGMVNISKTQLNEMVNKMVEEKLLDYLTKSYNKFIMQETIKSTINTLIKEGKIPTKKKTL